MKRRFLLIFCEVVFIMYCPAQATSFISPDIFQTAYFMENKGQFDQYSEKDREVKYAVDNDGDHFYFHSGGFIASLSKTERKENDENDDAEEKRTRTKQLDISMQWLNANKNCRILAEGKSKHYFSYGDPQYMSFGFRKLIYKDLYPNIDIEYTIPEKGGIKYTLVIRPGADLGNVKFTYSGDKTRLELSGNKLFIKNDLYDLTETDIVAYYSDSTKVNIRFYLEKNIVSFVPDKQVDPARTLIIDPWINSISTLTATGNGNNKGYDVDYDVSGNLFVYGAGKVGAGGTGENTKVAKYNPSGSLLWTFNGIIPSVSWQSRGEVGYIGNFVVNKSNGKVYIGQGYVTPGTQIVRLTTDAVYDTFISSANSNFQELWEMNFDCKTGTIFGMGGGTTTNINFGEISQSGSFTLRNITGYNYKDQDIISSTLNQNGEMYVIFADGVAAATPVNNHIMKLNSTYTAKSWDVYCGYNVFDELFQKPFVIGSVCSNGFNALCANTSYLYYYDGLNLKAFNLNNGSQAGSAITITGQSQKLQGGIYADQCNNVFIGCANGKIKTFHFDGSTFSLIDSIILNGMNGKSVYDIKFNAVNGMYYVSGNGFVAVCKSNISCSDSTIKISLVNDCSKAIVSVTNADTTTNFQYLWYDSTASAQVRNINNTLSQNDTLSTLVYGHIYSVSVIKEPLCGLSGTTFRFWPPCRQIDTFFCEGKSVLINGHSYNNAGVFNDTLKTAANTDSILIISIAKHFNSTRQINSIKCQGDTLKVGIHKYFNSGTYYDTLVNRAGCDSIITSTLTVVAKTAYSQHVFICSGDTFKLGPFKHFMIGNYIDALKSVTGCDSVIASIQLDINPKQYVHIDTSICMGDTFRVGIHKYYQSGVYYDSLKTITACDSVITTVLQIDSPLILTLNPSICKGDTFIYNLQPYTTAGTYQDEIKNVRGCDSVKAVINLSLLNTSNDTINIFLCHGDTVIVGGLKYFNAGYYPYQFTNKNGCDSFVTVNIQEQSQKLVNLTPVICYGESFRVNQHDYTRSGIYTDTISGGALCDSIIHTTLKVSGEPKFRIIKDTSLCEFDHGSVMLTASDYSGYLWEPGGESTPSILVSKAGIYICHGTDSANCFFTDTFHVTNNCGSVIFVPDAFTPDGDGINDYFIPSFSSISNFEMKIYNRWGELVFESVNTNTGWDGTYENKPVQEDVYIFIITAKGVDNKRISRKGTFTLLR